MVRVFFQGVELGVIQSATAAGERILEQIKILVISTHSTMGRITGGGINGVHVWVNPRDVDVEGLMHVEGSRNIAWAPAVMLASGDSLEFIQ